MVEASTGRIAGARQDGEDRPSVAACESDHEATRLSNDPLNRLKL